MFFGPVTRVARRRNDTRCSYAQTEERVNKVREEIRERLKSFCFSPPLPGAILGEDKPYLVPVRLGGPWEPPSFFTTSDWQLWTKGGFQCYMPGPRRMREHDGRVELFINESFWYYVDRAARLADVEWRPPKDWHDDLPEGCCLATDFVVGQRVRHKTEGDGFFNGVVDSLRGNCVVVLMPFGGKAFADVVALEGY